MRIGLKIIVTFVLISVNYAAKAQFTISKVQPKEMKTVPISDSIKYKKRIDNEFFNKARGEVERRKLRKKRNTTEFSATLQLSQTQFENWAAGGDNTFSGRSTIFFRHKHEREHMIIESRAEMRYGLNYIEKKKFKNEDEFKLNLQVSWKINKYWSYATNASLRSQMATGYKSRADATRVSTFMAPGFLDISAGIKYNRKPFSVILSPISGNTVFVLDSELREKGMNGVPKGASTKWKMGPSIKAEFDMEFWKQIFRVRSYLDAFTNIKKVPTMRWETTLDIRATKFLTTTIYALLSYDQESRAARPKDMQYKYSLSVGLSYTFKNK